MAKSLMFKCNTVCADYLIVLFNCRIDSTLK